MKVNFWPPEDHYFCAGIEHQLIHNQNIMIKDLLFINITMFTLRELVINLDKILSGRNRIIIIYNPKLEPVANYFFYNYASVKLVMSAFSDAGELAAGISKIYTHDRVWPAVDFTEMLNTKEFRLLQYIFNGYSIHEITTLTPLSRSSVYRLRNSIKKKLSIKDFYSFVEKKF